MDIERNYVRERTILENRNKKKKGTDYLVKVIYTQIVVCAIIFSLVFAINKLSPKTFDALKAQYYEIMQTDMSTKEVIHALESFGRFIVLPQEEEPIITTEEEDKTSQIEAEKKDESNLEGEVSAKQGENEIIQEESTFLEGVASATQGKDEIVQEESTLGSGGVDVGAKILGAQNASLAPCFITAPISVPVSGEISSSFGFRIHPVTGKEGFHTGMDIAAKEGARIGAAYYGKVVTADYSDGWGNHIVLEHFGGLATFYAHCSELLVEVGTYVRQGETIALVGNTGVSTGPHLHFEIRLNGVKHNPAWVMGLDTDAV